MTQHNKPSADRLMTEMIAFYTRGCSFDELTNGQQADIRATATLALKQLEADLMGMLPAKLNHMTDNVKNWPREIAGEREVHAFNLGIEAAEKAITEYLSGGRNE